MYLYILYNSASACSELVITRDAPIRIFGADHRSPEALTTVLLQAEAMCNISHLFIKESHKSFH